ncbi:MAG: pentapeptide repeat-containing protein [Cyanobacteria bacterium J06639_16]
MIQTIAGLGFFATAYLAWRNSQLAEDKNVTDRFSKAVEMLADERLEMRLGGIYSLERIARDSKEDHPVVMEVLTAFIRNRAGITEQRQQGSFISSFISQGNSQESAVKPNQDIQSALTVIGRRSADNDQQRLDLSRTDLKGANLERAHLEGVNLERAHLEGANLERAHLEGANLVAHLERANLLGAHLEGTNLRGAHLERANLREAHLEGANLLGAHLERAKLGGAHLKRVNLERAHLDGASLLGAHLEGAYLRGIHLERTYLRRAHLEGAYLGGAHLEGANFWEAHLEGADLSEAQLENAKGLAEDVLSQAKLCGTKLPEGIKLDPDRDCKELGYEPHLPDETKGNE